MKVSIQKKLILMYLFFYGGYVAFFPFLSTYAIKNGYALSDIGTLFLIYTMNKLKKEKEYYGALQED